MGYSTMTEFTLLRYIKEKCIGKNISFLIYIQSNSLVNITHLGPIHYLYKAYMIY